MQGSARGLTSGPSPRLNNDSDHCKRRATSQGRAALGDSIERSLSFEQDGLVVRSTQLYVKEKELLSKTDLIAKQKWWARCNATEPKTTKRRKEPEEPGVLASLFTLFVLVCLISACAADPQARQPAARRAA